MTRRAAPGASAALIVALALAAPGFVPATARADGDPASDALIAQDVFYPYSSPVPTAEQAALNRAVAAAHRSGVDLKVALIARASDLGSITALYERPQRYARFLDTEISFNGPVPLLVVMPDGYGVQGLSAQRERRIRQAAGPRGARGADLAAAATTVIDHALRVPRRAPASSSGPLGTPSERDVLLLALILAAVLVGGALVALRVFFPPRRT